MVIDADNNNKKTSVIVDLSIVVKSKVALVELLPIANDTL